MKIITVPDSRLRKKSTKVNHITDEARQIVQQMIDASLEWEKQHPHELSAAMAAPQLGINKRIIIIRDDLDDKTNASFTAFIDPENEKKMQKAVKELMKDKTVIAIAHKLRSVKDADKIVVLDKGRIADVGKHNELIKRCEIYGKLWKASEEAEQWSLIRKEGMAE